MWCTGLSVRLQQLAHVLADGRHRPVVLVSRCAPPNTPHQRLARGPVCNGCAHRFPTAGPARGGRKAGGRAPIFSTMIALSCFSSTRLLARGPLSQGRAAHCTAHASHERGGLTRTRAAHATEASPPPSLPLPRSREPAHPLPLPPSDCVARPCAQRHVRVRGRGRGLAPRASREPRAGSEYAEKMAAGSGGCTVEEQ